VSTVGTVTPGPSSPASPSPGSPPRASNYLWAQLMQRSFGFDVLACPRCGGRFKLLALIEDPAVVRRILTHLGRPTEVPRPRPPRAPPGPVGSFPLDNDPLLEIA
jgi:hypothetical protein